ncbi:hypothetical protein TSUD_180160 [Trifolium subterraneum]|uniref:Reverse transcriptase zinc-binding domain-containing protein n=1 Tax=Trifolium subterraneum TaxID=3900 RepID=A0A2Z6P990_TRISU|nr:hypothetical protein TSUD_180160 [Trifolium subterraneum]
MRKAVTLNLFKGFSIGIDSVVISHLQYADETLCIEEASVENLWALKAIFRGFELSSDLKTWLNPVHLSRAPDRGYEKWVYLGTSFGPSPEEEFLWGGVRGGNKIKRVKWSVVCKAKRMGGLGVRDVRLVNLSLLAKWRWRLLLPGSSLWKEVLVAKYGNQILQRVNWSDCRISTLASNCWKDICSLDKEVEKKNWLVESMERKVGNGKSTLFWMSNWIDEAPLPVVFTRLFSLSNQNNCMIRDFCAQEGECWRWSFSWRRELFQWEEDLVTRLREILEPVALSLVDDSWSLRPLTSYCPAPSKVIAFSWQLLYDRIPTRRNLEARGLLGLNMTWELWGVWEGWRLLLISFCIVQVL